MSTPHILIAVPTHNAAPTIDACLRSLRELDYPPHAMSIMVIDNGSTDGTPERVRASLSHPAWAQWHETLLLSQQENRGAASACHRAMEVCHAQWEFLLKIDHDVTATPPMLRLLMEIFTSRPQSGITGPTVLEAESCRIQSQGVRVNLWTGRVQLLHRSEWFHPSHEGARNVPAVSGCCCLISRGMLGKIGGFREEFFLSFDDTDLCYRLHQRGISVVLCPDAVVHHGGGKLSAPWGEQAIYFRLRNLIWFERLHASWWQWFTFLLGLPLHLLLTRFSYASHFARAPHLSQSPCRPYRAVLNAIAAGLAHRPGPAARPRDHGRLGES